MKKIQFPKLPKFPRSFKLPKLPQHPLKRRMAIMLIFTVSLFGLIFGFGIIKTILMNRFFAHFSLPPVTISATQAIQENWTPTLDAVGSLVAINGVQVTPEVSGMVTSIDFKSGQMVKAGQPLVQLDDSTDREDLKNLNAQLKLAQANFQRQAELLKTKSTSQASYDDAQAQAEEMQAQVAKTQLLIDKKRIKAPFDGKIGIAQVNLGQYLSPGTPLVNLQSLNPLYANFSLPEQNLPKLYVGQPVEVSVDSYPGKIFKGKITAIDAAIDVQTRNILIQATIPNQDLRLYPGLFANVKILLPTKKQVVTVPQTAISFSLYGNSVFVVVPDGKDKQGKAVYKVHRRYVTTGEQRENKIAVLKGIKANEQIVTSGQLKLDDGVQAYIDNSIQLPGLTPEDLEKNRT